MGRDRASCPAMVIDKSAPGDLQVSALEVNSAAFRTGAIEFKITVCDGDLAVIGYTDRPSVVNSVPGTGFAVQELAIAEPGGVVGGVHAGKPDAAPSG